MGNVHDEYCVFTEKETAIFNKIDTYFKNIAIQLGAIEYSIPAMISKDVLEKCGYFYSFPQQLTATAFVRPDAYEKVVQKGGIVSDYMSVSDQYLTPAACLHIYPTLENVDIDTKMITTKARVYRYENEKFDGKTRLWDFTVREIVLVGTQDFVLEKLSLLKEKSWVFCQEIGLPVKLIAASDHFFPTKRNEIKQKFQISNSLKYELVVPVGDTEVSIASFNFHGTHFSKPFHFDQSGRVLTSCIGYGLERWVSAIRHYNISI